MKNKSDKEPWHNSKTWKTKSAYFAWLRGVLRRGWSKSPIKISFKNSVRFKIPNPNPKGKVKEVWGHKCNICGYVGTEKEFQIDHKYPAGKLNDWEDVGPFVHRLLGCSPDDLQALCKTCHDCKSYSERYDISFEEAAIRKKIIAFKKLTLPQMQDKIWVECDIDSSGLTSKAQAVTLYEKMLRRKGANF